MLDLQRQREMLRQCSIAAALDTIGERWSFLILRGAFNGLNHFEEFQSTLGIARNILSNRLTRMVESGILAREPDPSDRRKVSYILTDKGNDLLPVLLSLRQWGSKWLCDWPANPVLVDKLTLQPIAEIAPMSQDGRVLTRNDMEWVDIGEVDVPRNKAA